MGYVEFRDIQDSRTQRIRIESESDCRASEIMLNDTKLEPISWELKIKTQFQMFAWAFGWAL